VNPVTLIGIVAMVAAMILYSIGVWGAFRAKKVSRRTVIFLVSGAVFDILGTAMMYLAAGGRFLWESPHTWVAMAALVGMLAAAIVAAWAVGGKDELLVKLSRWMLAPWALWAVVFVWGFFQNMPKK
jgi:hypothetical protein